MTLCHAILNQKTKQVEYLPICSSCGIIEKSIPHKTLQKQFKKLVTKLRNYLIPNTQYKVVLHLCPECHRKHQLGYLSNPTEYYDNHSLFTEKFLQNTLLKSCENPQHVQEKETVH